MKEVAFSFNTKALITPTVIGKQKNVPKPKAVSPTVIILQHMSFFRVYKTLFGNLKIKRNTSH